jgi:hypothetical protein
MSDEVYDKDNIAFTRYWGGKKGDMIQITIRGECGYAWACLTVEELHEAVKAVDASVEETKNAWWHG